MTEERIGRLLETARECGLGAKSQNLLREFFKNREENEPQRQDETLQEILAALVRNELDESDYPKLPSASPAMERRWGRSKAAHAAHKLCLQVLILGDVSENEIETVSTTDWVGGQTTNTENFMKQLINSKDTDEEKRSEL